LQLRNGSAIAVEANGDRGDGGSLTINAETIALLSGSKITANSLGGNGGNIGITARGLFPSQDSAITASSQLGVDGVVEVDTPSTDPTRGLIELSNNVVDAASLISKDFCAIRGESAFIATGRGGLPSNPLEMLGSNNVRVSLVSPVSPYMSELLSNHYRTNSWPAAMLICFASDVCLMLFAPLWFMAKSSKVTTDTLNEHIKSRARQSETRKVSLD